MKIGIVVGHNKIAQGAKNYMGETEFSFNSRVARKLKLKLSDQSINSHVIERSHLSYLTQIEELKKTIQELKLTHTFHLHFNSHSGHARGCEVLIVSRKSEWMADIITDQLNIHYNFHERADDGVKLLTPGHRGYDMLSAVESTGAYPVLIEPCFGNYRTFESKFIFENEDKYVALLCDCIEALTWSMS